jgi:integrase
MENLSPAQTYIDGLAEGSRRTMREALDLAARHLSAGAHDREAFDWPALRYPQLVQLRTWLEQAYAPATGNKILCAIRGTLEACADLDLISTEEYRKRAKIKSLKATHVPKGRMLSLGEQGALMAACWADNAGARDAAILVVLLRAGLRRSEVVALDLADWLAHDRMLYIRGGKGNKDRQVPLPSSAVPILEGWLRVRGQAPGPLFHQVNKGGAIGAGRLTDQAVLVILKRLATRGHVENFSPHDCRRTYISSLFDAGVDIATIQKLAGHNDPATTSAYDRRGDDTKRRAVDLLPDLWPSS